MSQLSLALSLICVEIDDVCIVSQVASQLAADDGRLRPIMSVIVGLIDAQRK